MKKLNLDLIASLVFFLVTAGGFYWLWIQSNATVANPVSNPKNYTVVEIESSKTQASDILGSLEKNSEIPLSAPTAKMGRTNPFSGL